MPQLDIVTFNFVNISVFTMFWIYFIVMYVAVSYSMHKVSSGFYFKFFMLNSMLISVWAFMDIIEDAESDVEVSGITNTIPEFDLIFLDGEFSTNTRNVVLFGNSK